MKKLLKSTAFILVLAIIAGSLVGFGLRLLPADAVVVGREVLMSLKKATGQIIFFMVPLLIFGCVTPSITRLSGNVTKLLAFAIGIAYISSIAAAFFSLTVSHYVVPLLDFGSRGDVIKLPDEPLVNLSFPTMDTMSALLLAVVIGLGVVWTGYKAAADVLERFQQMILVIVRKILLPLLPVFVGSNFALLAYTGQISNMGIFLPIVAVIVLCQLVWIALMYVVASIYSGRNGWQVLRYYPKAYFTALGSMSSAATLPFALECIAESPVVRKETYDFTLPLFSNVHLCGSVIAEMALVTATYYSLYGVLPPTFSLVIFAIVACVIAIGSPGVPGGLNVACSTIIGSIILAGANAETFVGIMTAIYTVQDGFGTACNVTTDGALTLITDKKVRKYETLSE
ncbi:MAG: dicarboxylate/amino acid:cation symporter [Muribaculaceae bacterium]|nr:dicarboxylate/amino acid:cation symporter [Muribaculaceae bacterium]